MHPTADKALKIEDIVAEDIEVDAADEIYSIEATSCGLIVPSVLLSLAF